MEVMDKRGGERYYDTEREGERREKCIERKECYRERNRDERNTEREGGENGKQ